MTGLRSRLGRDVGLGVSLVCLLDTDSLWCLRLRLTSDLGNRYSAILGVEGLDYVVETPIVRAYVAVNPSLENRYLGFP